MCRLPTPMTGQSGMQLVSSVNQTRRHSAASPPDTQPGHGLQHPWDPLVSTLPSRTLQQWQPRKHSARSYNRQNLGFHTPRGPWSLPRLGMVLVSPGCSVHCSLHV